MPYLSTFVAVAAFSLSVLGWRMSRDQERQHLKAYVGIKEITTERPNQPWPKLLLAVKNFGQTPASPASMSYSMELRTVNRDRVYSTLETKLAQQPNMTIFPTEDLDFPNDWELKTIQKQSDFTSHKTAFVIFGTINY